MHWDWGALCGRNDSGFSIWNASDFGHCFEQLVISSGSHALLAIISAYHFSRHQHRRLRGDIPHVIPLHFRMGCGILLAVAPLVLLSLTYLYIEEHPSMIDIITCAIRAVSWLIHSGFLHRLKRLYHIHIRGPPIVVLTYCLTAASMVIQLRTVILHHNRKTSYFNIVEEVITYIMSGLHVVYVLTLVPWKRAPVTHDGRNEEDGINNSETQGLLGSESRVRDYNTIPPMTQELGVAQTNSNCVSNLFFWWVQPLMVKGSKGGIEKVEDLFHLPSSLSTKFIDNKFQEVNRNNNISPRNEAEIGGNGRFNGSINADLESTDSLLDSDNVIVRDGGRSSDCASRIPMSMIGALNRTFGCEFYSLGILKFLGDTLGFAGPIILNYLVTYMENKSEPVWHGYVYASCLFAATFVSSMLATHFDYLINITGMKIRAAIITSVYRKSLKVSSVSMSKFSSGEVVNFMSTDCDRVVNFCPSFHQFWSLPIQVGISLFLLYSQVGLAFLAGLGFAIILIPINKKIADKIGSLSTDMMEQKDNRVKVMNEILAGIRVIKFYAWEPHFAKRVDTLRTAEVKSLKWRKYLDALCVYFWATTPVLISILTFMTYSLLGHQLTAAKVFTSMALFNMLIVPLNAFPWVLNGLVEAWVSVKRLQKFFSLSELDYEEYYTTMQENADGLKVEIEHGHFTWSSAASADQISRTTLNESSSIGPDGFDERSLSNGAPSKTLDLLGINLKIAQGTLVGVVGKVGSGKSSLLSAISAEMQREHGSICVDDLNQGFGLVAQEAWIQHATIKENIVHGQPYDEEKYHAVIEACALSEDIKVLPAGDSTEIGENGVTLSGGQKARVSLARAVYQNKDIYLLDDPLAAVDTHVAHHLFNECIMGLLKHKTRVLCTHHTKYLRQADVVVLMEDGKIKAIGQPSDILRFDNRDETESVADESGKSTEPGDDITEDSADLTTTSGTLVAEEGKDTGVVKWHVYKSYWGAVGHCLAPVVLLALFLMQASKNLSDWWLSYWVTHSHHTFHNTSDHPFLLASIPETTFRSSVVLQANQHWRNITEADDNIEYYLMVYGIIAGCNTLFTFFRAFLFAYGGLNAAVEVHDKLLASILKTPIRFFDVTPIGRIINRFSTDVYSVDDSMPFILNIFLAQSYALIGTLVVTCYGLPWFGLLLIPLAVIYYFVQKYYRHTSRELKRITSVTLSPVYAHFSETIGGLATIRAFRESDRFQVENQDRLETNQRALFCSKAASKWLGIRLQMVGVAMVTGVAFIAVLEHHFQTVNPGLVGLAISYALSVTNLLNGVVVFFTETEMQMVSVERACQYTNDLPREKNWAILNAPPFWPIQGAVSFKNVCLRYRAGLPLALNNVTFETQPAEKIGIVGRTGAGKSSLFLTLFRMMEIQSGQIFIDGINISHLPLDELRSRLAIIPQDPFLFSGTVRHNLDPTNCYTDTELWGVLERCHLRDAVCRLGGLEAEVAERGRHFSLGQRQLVCLARALLTKAKVLCIDEATASVDEETDTLVQETIREEFRDNTVLTIAHRTHTIMDSDRVLVMDGGQVAEFDKPAVLLAKTNSLFYGFVHGN